LKTLASLAPPVGIGRGSMRSASSAVEAICTAGADRGIRYALNSSSTTVSRSHSASLAPAVSASTICDTSSPARSWSRLRASSSTEHVSATTFTAVPPSIRPTFAVVCSSIRPSSSEAIALAAASIALRPSSGRIPAWAEAPRKRPSIR